MRILGCRLDPLGSEKATAEILKMARGSGHELVVTLGTEMVVYAQRDADFRQVINGAALCLCDTVGLLAVAKLRGAKLHGRVTGVELIEGICAGCARDGLSVYLLGGSDDVAARAASALASRYPGLRVAGAEHGYFSDEQTPEVTERIRTSGAAILFAGLGFPRQELWLARFLERTGCAVGIGVGGSFDVISGKLARAPNFWRRFGLEWMYRLLREPWRWRRQLALPQFVLLALQEMLGLRRANSA